MARETERPMTGAQIVCESLKREGVEVIFGLPGGPILPLYNTLFEQYPELRHILVRHEQGAAYAADGYARASGKVGVCLATSGPGATNLVTGIAAAYLDSSPIVAITGQVASHLIGSDAFQEADITGIILPVTKHRNLVRRTEDLASTIKEAFYLARTGRPGPVLIDISTNVFRGEAPFNYPDGEPVIPGYWPQEMKKKDRIFQMERQVEKAIKVIEQAESPVIIAGRGIVISGAYSELKELAEMIQAPVASTLHGLAAFPQDNLRAIGMIGMHGTNLANTAIKEADLIIAIGMRFDDRATTTSKGLAGFAPNARVIHIDIDPAEVGKNVRVDVPIVGDAKTVLQFLNLRVSNQIHTQWISQIEQWRREYPTNLIEQSEELLPQYCVKCIYDITEGNATVVTGVGQHQMWAAQYFVSHEPNRLISSGGLGQMGFGLPAAIGVQVARPGETVWVIDGDGSFQMTLQELATVVKEKLPIKMAIINNGYLGMVRQWQERFYNRRYAATPLSGPDFVKLAGAYNITALRVTRQNMVKRAIYRAMEHKGPFLIDCQVKQDENVRPFVFVIPLNLPTSSPDVGSIQKEGIGLKQERVLVALVQDKSGVLDTVASLYRRRGFNLKSVTVGPCEMPGLSRMTIVVETNKGDEQQLEQARKQSAKLISVVEVIDVTDKDFTDQEMVLIQVNVRLHPERRQTLQEQADTFGAKIVKTTQRSVVIGVMGGVDDVEKFIKNLEDLRFKIGKIARSGLVALLGD